MENNDKPKYLSELMEKHDINKWGNKICILSGVGSGKNYWVEEVLTKSGNVLLITSRKAITDGTAERSIFEKVLSKEIINKDNYVVYNNASMERIIENQLLVGNIEELQNPIIDYFDYIVVDEVHSLISDCTYQEAPYHVWTFINEIARYKPVILMTGTYRPIIKTLKNNGWKFLNALDKCKNIKPEKIIIENKKEIFKVINELISQGQKTIYMANSANNIVKNLYEDFQNICNIDKKNIAFSMSDEKGEELVKVMQNGELERMTNTYDSIIRAC